MLVDLMFMRSVAKRGPDVLPLNLRQTHAQHWILLSVLKESRTYFKYMLESCVVFGVSFFRLVDDFLVCSLYMRVCLKVFSLVIFASFRCRLRCDCIL